MNTKRDIGNIGENLAIKYLIARDYLILDKNYHAKHGEIDIIIWDKNQRELVFVEVKTRTNQQYGWPEEAINQVKRQRMRRTAQKYLNQKHYHYDQNYRFDSIAVELNLKTRLAKISHFKYI